MTIKVKVELMPGLRQAQQGNVFDLELPDNSTLKSLLIKMGFKEEEIEYLRTFVNEKIATAKKALKDGDNIWVGIILGGGLIRDEREYKNID